MKPVFQIAATAGAALAPARRAAWHATASNHREAPITALDHKADITDLWAFVSYSGNQLPAKHPKRSR